MLVWPVLIIIFNLLICRLQATSQTCQPLFPPLNGHFVGGLCQNQLNAACVINCNPGYSLVYGSTFRQCLLTSDKKAIWTGKPTFCQINICPNNSYTDKNLRISCSTTTLEFRTKCDFTCAEGYRNIGSHKRYCLAISQWSGLTPKCKRIENYTPSILKVSNIAPLQSILTKPPIINLSNETLFFGYNFKKIKLEVSISNYPVTFRMWARTNYTSNIKILTYTYQCFQISILTDQDSTILLSLNNKYNYKLNELRLLRNQWLLLTTVHTQNELNFYVNGVFQLDILKLKIEPDCDSFNQTETRFRAAEELDILETDVLQPMHGEITHVYLLNKSECEEDVLKSFYECGSLGVKDGNSVVFDWTKVDWFGTGLEGFKRRISGFCKNCEKPEIPKYSAINYEGVQSGDVRAYKCIRGFDIVGYASSVCMVYGDWSHKTPRCKVNREEYKRYKEEVESEAKKKVVNNRVKIIDEKFFVIV